MNSLSGRAEEKKVISEILLIEFTLARPHTRLNSRLEPQTKMFSELPLTDFRLIGRLSRVTSLFEAAEESGK